MSFDVDEDILQDFLIEAGEILELLSEQLVQLENEPDNRDLLNAIFRGFHTVKGGAGFLSLTELVHTSHAAENVFDTLRNGQREVTSELMDVILQALDTINAQFAQVQAREESTPASQELIDTLEQLSQPQSEDEQAPAASTPPTAVSGDGGVDEITDAEFESLLDELHGSQGAPGKASASQETSQSAASDDITDDEFESLLDEIHGKGKINTASAQQTSQSTTAAAHSLAENSSVKKSGTENNEHIDDDEFEALLDDLHGKGSFKADAVSPAKSSPASPKSEANQSEANKSENKPSAKPTPAAAAQPANKAASKAPPIGETTVRVDTRRLDEIMNMVGELVLVRNRLLSLDSRQENEDEELSKTIANLDVVTGDLQGAVMKTRMQPIKKVFGRFPRVVRDLARTLKKEINLELSGEDTDLDKNLVEALADPLVHLVRNAVDHGVEMPEEREKAGKPRVGQIKLSASQEGDHILLTIADDGAGMDAEKLKDIAIKRGVLDQDAASRMSDEEAYNLIFAAGFSTKVAISDVSGRGVGMDVVKTKISQLNGSVRITSELGRGTTLQIKVPLTLAILPTLMVLVAKQAFALPLAQVSEIIGLEQKLINTVDGQRTLIVREKAIPLFYLEHWLKRGADRSVTPTEGHVVVLHLGTQQVGLVVDGLIGQEEVVIKPLDSLLQGTPGMAGATITSDGGIALILDTPNLLKHYAKR